MTQQYFNPQSRTHEGADHQTPEREYVACPECGLPAEVEWRTSVGSTGGPMEHLKIRCVDRHWFLLPAHLVTG